MTRTVVNRRHRAPAHAPLAAVVAALLSWHHRHRARVSLARLDAHLLRDIGLDLGEVEKECSKPFWRD